MLRKYDNTIYNLDSYSDRELMSFESQKIADNNDALNEYDSQKKVLNETCKGVLYVLCKRNINSLNQIDENFIPVTSTNELMATNIPFVRQSFASNIMNMLAPFSKSDIQNFNNLWYTYLKNLSHISTPHFTYVSDILKENFYDISKFLRLIGSCSEGHRANLISWTDLLMELYVEGLKISKLSQWSWLRNLIERFRRNKRNFEVWFKWIRSEDLQEQEYTTLFIFYEDYIRLSHSAVEELEKRESL